MKTILALLALSIALVGCSKTPEPVEVQLKFKTVMECINDAKLNDRDMKLIGEKVTVLEVDEFVLWYNGEFGR